MDDDSQAAFHKLKIATIEAPLLALQTSVNLLLLQKDALGTGIGPVFQQERHPVSYYRKKSLHQNEKPIDLYTKATRNHYCYSKMETY